MCDSPWTGRSCQTYACDPLLSSSTDKENVTVEAKFHRLLDITYNDRPVYYSNDTKNVVFYSSGRFNVYQAQWDDLEDDALRKNFANYHDHWDSLFGNSFLKQIHASEYTIATMPIESTESVAWIDNWGNDGSTIEFKCQNSTRYSNKYCKEF
jgi:hypothetical protein